MRIILIAFDDEGSAAIAANDFAQPVFQIFVARVRVQVAQVDFAKADRVVGVDDGVAFASLMALASAIEAEIDLLGAFSRAILHVMARFATPEALNRASVVTVAVRRTINFFMANLPAREASNTRGLKSYFFPGKRVMGRGRGERGGGIGEGAWMVGKGVE